MRHLFHTRAALLRPFDELVDGLAQLTWQKVQALVDPLLGVPGEFMCRIDLGYQRPGKDQPMPLVAGRAPDRVGLLFCDPTDEIRSGDRIHCIEGPVQGTFELRVMPDPAVGFGAAHHLEAQVVEVSNNMKSRLGNRTEGGSF